MDKIVKQNLIDSYQADGGFIVHDCMMLQRLYKALGIFPKGSLDPRIFELEGITHFFQPGVVGLARKIGISKEDRVLSLGEGSGAPSRLLVKMFGCKMVGVDINPDQINKARECLSLHGLENKIDYYEQNVEDLSLDKNDFTKAFCNETCCHWQEKAKAFKRIGLHLCQGAKMGLNIWLKGDRGDLNDAYARIPEFRELYKRGIWFQDDLNDYQRFLKEAGFTVLEMFECTDKIDIKMRARVKANLQWQRYGSVMGYQAKEQGLNYYSVMLKTHYDFLRYGVVIAEKNE